MFANKADARTPSSKADRGPVAALQLDHPSSTNGQALLQSLHRAVHDCADQELAKHGQGADDCPYISAWFSRHAGDSEARLRQAAHRYAPKSAGARSDADFIEQVVDRVRKGLQANLANGSLSGVPAELPQDLEARQPKQTKSDMPGRPVLQRCGSTEEDAPRQGHPLAQVRIRERRYEQDPTPENLDAWDRQLRADVGIRFRTLPLQQQQEVTATHKRIAAQRRILQADERRERAQALRETLGRTDTSSTKMGVPNARIIRDYTSPDTGKAEAFFNKPLRELDATEEQAAAITSLQNSLLMSPVYSDGDLWRGTGHLIGGAEAATVRQDERYREPGFLSTSRKRSIAEGFGKGRGPSQYMIRIRRHKSGREILSLGGDEYGGGEEEILFPAGCTFRYLGYSKTDRCHDYEEG